MPAVEVDFERLTGSRAAFRRLDGRGLFRVTGADRVRFLDGMLTRDIAGLASGASCHALLLDRKGRVLADLFALAFPGEHLLDTAPGTGERVLETLRKHVVADDVEIEPAGTSWSEVAFEGPGAAEAVRRAGGCVPAPGRTEREGAGGEGLLWWGGGSLTPAGVRLLGPREQVERAVLTIGLPELAAPLAERVRIEAFLPAYGVDVSERNLPQEAGLEGAISPAKGCYVGQEIVARIQSRGGVNRLLVQLRAEAPVHAGDPIAIEGRVVGSVTSAASDPAQGGVALGYVPGDHAAPGTPVRIGAAPARVIGPRR